MESGAHKVKESDSSMELSPESVRFLPLVKSIVSQIRRELVPDINPEALMQLGLNGLSDGFAQYKSRQGLTLRAYLIYRIRSAVYAGLRGYQWKQEDTRRFYVFLKKTNELLLNFHLSAEGAIKRSIEAEEEDLLHLLSILAVVALLSGSKTCELEMNDCIRQLDSKDQNFIRYYYDQDYDLVVVSEKIGISHSTASRFHLQVLEKLARSTLKHGLKEVARSVKAEGLKGEALTAKVVDTVLTQMFGKDFLSSPDAAALRETITRFLAQDEHLSTRINNLITRLGNKS